MFWTKTLKYVLSSFKPLQANFTKWPNILKQFVGNLLTNCLSVFGHFVGLALKGLKRSNCYVILFSLCKNSRKSHQRCSIKKLLSKILQYSQENNCVFRGRQGCWKETPNKCFFREYSEFYECLFRKTFANNCFWNSPSNQTIFKNSIV